MRIQRETGWLELAPELIDDVLVEASRSASAEDREAFIRDREAIAGIETIDIREKSYRSFDAQWLDRFGVLAGLEGFLGPHAFAGCVLRRVKSSLDERAVVSQADGERVLLIDLRPPTLLRPEALIELFERSEPTSTAL